MKIDIMLLLLPKKNLLHIMDRALNLMKKHHDIFSIEDCIIVAIGGRVVSHEDGSTEYTIPDFKYIKELSNDAAPQLGAEYLSQQNLVNNKNI